MSVCLLRSSVHNAFATIHLFWDCLACNFKYRLFQRKPDTLAVHIVCRATIISSTRVSQHDLSTKMLPILSEEQECLSNCVANEMTWTFNISSSILQRNSVSRVIFSGFIRFEWRALRKSVCSLLFLLAVENH